MFVPAESYKVKWALGLLVPVQFLRLALGRCGGPRMLGRGSPSYWLTIFRDAPSSDSARKRGRIEPNQGTRDVSGKVSILKERLIKEGLGDSIDSTNSERAGYTRGKTAEN